MRCHIKERLQLPRCLLSILATPLEHCWAFVADFVFRYHHTTASEIKDQSSVFSCFGDALPETLPIYTTSAADEDRPSRIHPPATRDHASAAIDMLYYLPPGADSFSPTLLGEQDVAL